MKELNKKENEENLIDGNTNLYDIKNYFGNIIKDENEKKILFGEDNNVDENNLLVMNKLQKVFKKIEGQYKDVKVIEREIDNNSFKFLFHIEQDNQGEMFKTILNIKSNMNEVSEVSMNIESFENIVTKFQ
jgi:hypothetical protein